MFGGEAGFTQLGLAKGWQEGPVSSFLPGGYDATGPWPSQVQVPGYPAPPTWSSAGGDYCTPFTWSKTHFDKAAEVTGSYGRYLEQDVNYFEPTCLTELPPTTMGKDSLSYTTERIKFFSGGYAAWKCYGFRKDVLLCADGAAEDVEKKHPPTEEVRKLMGDTFDLDTCMQQFGNDAAGQSDCQEAGRRTKCKTVVAKATQACEAQYSACEASSGDGCAGALASCTKAAGQHSIKKGDHSTSSLAYYNSNYDAKLSHAVFKPQDSVVSQGLHSVVMYYAANAVAIASAPEFDKEKANSDFAVYWNRLAKYMGGDSGMEFGLGLIKSILIYQHEAISKMRNNTDVTVSTFSAIIVILLLQFAFLSQRIGVVTRDTYGMLRAIGRFIDQIKEMQQQNDHKNLVAKEKAEQKTLADEDSEDIGSDDASEEAGDME